MFDLPIVKKDERQRATAFRNDLLDLGFEMSQFSVYLRYCTGSAQAESCCRKVEAALPPGGRVNILQFTDKQYERIICYRGQRKQPAGKSPDQFALF